MRVPEKRLTLLRFALLSTLAGCGASPGAADDAAGGMPTPDAGTVDSGVLLTRPLRYVRGDTDGRLVIEIDSVAGARPRVSVENDLVARLRTLLDKPAGVEIVHDDEIPSRGADHAWTNDELYALADETFDDAAPPGTIVMHVLWLDGHDADDTADGAVLGSAWANTHIAMFHRSIERTCSGDILLSERLCAAAQYGVWLHEVGHTIGLVNNGLPLSTPHEDPAHARHDLEPGCVMYYAYEASSGIGGIRDGLLGGTTPDFDPACLADIAAARAP